MASMVLSYCLLNQHSNDFTLIDGINSLENPGFPVINKYMSSPFCFMYHVKVGGLKRMSGGYLNNKTHTKKPVI